MTSSGVVLKGSLPAKTEGKSVIKITLERGNSFLFLTLSGAENKERDGRIRQSFLINSQTHR